MRTLVIVHLEPAFQSSSGRNLEQLSRQVKSYSRTFDRVINITSVEVMGDGVFEALENFQSKEWIWGFDYETRIDEEPERWVEGKDWIFTTGHEASEILDWMHELRKKDSYTLVGGARSECLQDIYDIFLQLNLKTRIKETLTY